MTTETMTTATETMTADDNAVYCEACGTALTDTEVDEIGYECTKCYAAHTFTCQDCGEVLDNEDKSPKCKTRCLGCQEQLDEEEEQEAKTSLQEQAQEYLDLIFVDADVKTLRRLLKTLKKINLTVG